MNLDFFWFWMLYVIPFVVCGWIGILDIRRGLMEDSIWMEADPDHYKPEVTIGYVLGSLLICVLPVINLSTIVVALFPKYVVRWGPPLSEFLNRPLAKPHKGNL